MRGTGNEHPDQICGCIQLPEGAPGTIKYIVLHYTANDGDTAKGNCNYFQGKNRGASAHYFVDETSVWQSVRDTDTAWSVGGGLQSSGGHAFYKICTNSNSISIEMCSKNREWAYTIPERTVDNAVELTKLLMGKYGIPIDRIIRHYDVNGKICPKPWVEDENQWAQFKIDWKEKRLTWKNCRNYGRIWSILWLR